MPRIIGVIAGSIADEGGVVPGEELVSVNGEKISDVFDYLYQTSACDLEILLKGADGGEWVLDVEKTEDEDPGLLFENDLLDEPRPCGNHCVFCFIDQLPPGMRESLYFKDDDLRLSFLNGNYVTLTNAGGDELSRIVKYGLTPANVSVHTTDAALRALMLGHGTAGGHTPERFDVLPKIKYLTESGISVNAQIVLCKHYNDGAALDMTLDDLGRLNDRLVSISVVPSGLTKFRAGLTPLEAFDRDSAGIVINQISRWQKKFMKTRGRRTVYASDEFYALSGRRWPGDAFYGGYPQLENGVGMTALFKKQFNDGLSRVKRGEFNAKFGAPANVPGPSYIFTGQAAAAMIGQCVEKLQAMFACMDITVIPVENAFFGEKVTVSGLLTGRDIENKAKTIDFPPKSRIFISKTMLKYGSNVFLDNYSIQMLQNILKIDIIAVENDGYALVRALLS